MFDCPDQGGGKGIEQKLTTRLSYRQAPHDQYIIVTSAVQLRSQDRSSHHSRLQTEKP